MSPARTSAKIQRNARSQHLKILVRGNPPTLIYWHLVPAHQSIKIAGG